MAERKEKMARQISMNKRSINELREMAVSLGADRKRLYGTSKTSLILIIDRLKRENQGK